MKATANAARTAFPDRTQYESTEDIPPRLHAQRAGLSTSEARQCPSQYGANALAEVKVSPLGRLLRYFRGFTPVPVEVPAGEARRGEP
ncbi:MAG TPA: cation-transporting P-type ATPase [Gammaproteobacteria bacterium]|nr:cation-transporting P-type ATPase [Gammaproteobacteria bacterium]